MAGALMIAVPVVLGIFTYYRVIDYTGYRFFADEIQHPLGGWMALSAGRLPASGWTSFSY
jgi:hypothetical protein